MMKFYTFIIFFSITTISQAQFGLQKKISSASDPVNHEQYIRTCDVDGDGKIDVLVGGRGSNNIRYFRNLGNLAFDSTAFLPVTFLDLKSIETADFNNDGKPDIVSLDVQLRKLFWHPNTNGLFPQQILILDNLDVQFGRVICNDFNGDGNIDIVISTFFNALLFLNDGAGNFSIPQKVMLEADEEEIYDHVFGDFNNDGFIDLALAGNGFLIYLNDGSGNFTKAPYSNIGISFLLESADYNNDQYDDLLMHALNKLMHFENSPTGFGNGPLFTPNNYNFQTITSADLDNDGDVDVLTQENQGNKFMWYENVNAGTSWVQHVIPSNVADGSGYGVNAADLDNDGDKDIIRTTSTGNVFVYENLKISTLSTEKLIENNITVFPNPASGNLTINGIDNAVLEIQIVDLSGKLIYCQKQVSSNTSINVSHLKTGNYFIKIIQNEEVAIRKLSILH